MIYQISSGQGPAECELGVAKFLTYLQKHYAVSVLETHRATMKTPIVPCGLKPKKIYHSLLARCSESVKVPTAPVTNAKTGFWISAVAPQPKQKHSIQSW